MDSAVMVRNFLQLSNPPPPPTLAVEAPPQTSLPAPSQLQRTYYPVEYNEFDPQTADLCEYPELSIDEATVAVHPGRRVSIKKETLLDHRSIVKVFHIHKDCY